MTRTTSQDMALLLLRLVGLYLALGHGLGKIVALTSGSGAHIVRMVDGLGFPAPVLFAWALALAEFAGGLCVFVGLRTRVAAFFPAFAMLVAAFVNHGAMTRWLAWIGLSGAPPEQIRAAGNPELAILYLLSFATLVVLGGGRLSLDERLKGRRFR